MGMDTLKSVLHRRGYAFGTSLFRDPDKPRKYGKRNQPTLEEFASSNPKGFYIVNVTGHFVALCNGIVADNSVRFGVPVDEHPSRRKWVKEAIHILGASQ